MKRRILILTGVLVAQLALIAALFWPRATQATAGPLFAGFDAAAVSSIKLTWDTDSLTLARQGDQWVLPEAGDFPVNTIAVTEVLSKVQQIDTDRLVADTATSHARLRVDDAGAIRRVEMTGDDGETWTLYVGSSPTARATHVRRGGSDAVYLTSALSTADVRTDEGAWIDTIYLERDPAAVRALSLVNANGSFDLQRDAGGEWALAGLAAGESVNGESADTLASRFASLAMVRPLGKELKPEYGLETPAATITLELTPTASISGTAAAAPETTVVQVGALDAATSSYPVKASSSDYVVAVAAATLDPFVNWGRADLVASPPVTATETLTGTGAVTPTFTFTPTAP